MCNSVGHSPSLTKKLAAVCVMMTACSLWLIPSVVVHSNTFFSGCHWVPYMGYFLAGAGGDGYHGNIQWQGTPICIQTETELHS